MSQFKIGDWVRCIFNTNVVFLISNEKEFEEFSRFDPMEYKLWQPEEGEWCWFYNHRKEIPKLGRLKYYDTKYTAFMTPISGMSVQKFTYCEPFIGKLPSFLRR